MEAQPAVTHGQSERKTTTREAVAAPPGEGGIHPSAVTRPGRYSRNRTKIRTVLTVLVGAALWQFAAAHASTLVLVPLQDIGRALVEQAQDGMLWTDLLASSSGFALGLLVASVAGILIGVAMAISGLVFDFLDPWVSALYSTPLIALAPLFIIVFGIGLEAKVAVVITLAIFPVIINTTAGIRTTDTKLMETARSFGAGRLQILRKVMLPWSLPFILTGLRLAVGRALIGVVVAEFFGSRNGLGHSVFVASQNFDTANVWVGVFVLALIGTLLIRFMYSVERKIAPWRAEETV